MDNLIKQATEYLQSQSIELIQKTHEIDIPINKVLNFSLRHVLLVK